MSDSFKLPVSSYDELIKIIKVYGNGKVGNSVSLDDLVKSSGMSRTVISKNNGFLMHIGLITKGNKKAPTEACKKLANAYSMNLQDKVSSLWKSIFEQDEFISSMVSFVSIKSRVSRPDYIGHILYSAGCANAPSYRAGASAIIDILKMLKVINEQDGYIILEDTSFKTELIPPNVKESIANNEASNQITFEQPTQSEANFFVQQYTCESGQIAKIIIPENASEDDLLGFKDMLNITLRRKFKLKEGF